MPYVTVDQENSSSIDLYYEDLGSEQPVMLAHGFPLSGRFWEKHTLALLQADCRVITYDRRGFDQSSQPTIGYDYDTFADDLHKLITKLDLRDIVLAGMSMGGGEVARYLGRYGSERVSKAAVISGVPPFLLKTADNPEGVDKSIFDGILDSIARDRLAFQPQFLADFFNTDVYLGKRVSEEVIRDCWNVAAGASPFGTAACVPTWYMDFRGDLARIDVPTLVLHGDADRILPLATSGLKTHAAIKGSRLVVLEGASHGLLWTHADGVNRALLEFIRQPAGVRTG